MHGVLIAISKKRRALLDEDADLLHEILDVSRTEPVPGLLHLGKAWHALDVLLSDESDALLGDAVLARRGSSYGPALAYGRAKLLEPDRVAELAGALDALGEDLVQARYERLRGREVHGGYGPKQEGPVAEDVDAEAELAELRTRFESLRELYRTAAQRGEAILAVVT